MRLPLCLAHLLHGRVVVRPALAPILPPLKVAVRCFEALGVLFKEAGVFVVLAQLRGLLVLGRL